MSEMSTYGGKSSACMGPSGQVVWELVDGYLVNVGPWTTIVHPPNDLHSRTRLLLSDRPPSTRYELHRTRCVTMGR